MGERILVFGGRHFEDERAVFEALDQIAETLPILMIIQGGCQTGADRFGRKWAIANNHHQESFLADWKTYGRAAGPIRNQEMIDRGKPTRAIGFPGGRGTADMARRLQRAGIPTTFPLSPAKGPEHE